MKTKQMRQRVWLLSVLGLLWLAGCQASTLPVEDGGDDVDDGASDTSATDGGDDIDASTDGGDDTIAGDADPTEDTDTSGPAVPTAPVVLVTPAAPTTVDDLVARVTTESVSPNGEPVTYEFVWTSSTGVTLEGDTVTADLTSKGEVWGVEVTPVAGELRGVAGEVDVTIGNALPIVRTARLDRYVVYTDESIQVIVDPEDIVDADGDPTAAVITWKRNGQDLAGITSHTLNLVSQGAWEEGDELTVEVAARNGVNERGPAITLGPVTVHAAATRWRALLPSFAGNDGFYSTTVYDPANDRLLLMGMDGLWEADPDTLPLRWVRLQPALPPSLGQSPTPLWASIVFDSINERFIVLGYAFEDAAQSESEVFGTFDTYALDVSQRGDEAWTVLEPLGTGPTPRGFSGAFFHEASGRVFLYGGFEDLDVVVALDEMWTLDVETPGAETWQRVEAGGDAPIALMAPVFIPGPSGDHVLLTGGMTQVLDEAATYNQQVWLLSPTEGEERFELLDVSVPGNVAGRASGVDPETNTAYFFTGGQGDTRFRLWAFDFVNRLASEIDLDDAPTPAFFFYDTFLTNSGGLRFFGPVRLDPLSQRTVLGLYDIDLEEARWEPRYIQGVHAPNDLREPVAVHDRYDEQAFYLVGGERDSVEMDTMWRFDLSQHAWAEVEVAADPTSGLPVSRQQHALVEGGYEPIIFGGYPTQGGSPLNDAWQLNDSSGSWSWRKLEPTAASPLPPPMSDAVAWAPFCGGAKLNLIGPMSSAGSGFAEHWTMDRCSSASGTRECLWEVLQVGGSPPPPMYGAALAVDQEARQVVTYGGRSTSGGFVDVVRVADTCLQNTASWNRAITSGAAPSPREGHTLTADHSLVRDFDVMRFFLYGGRGSASGPLGDVWLLTHNHIGDTWSWTEVHPMGDAPPARDDHVAVWDESRQRLLITGGRQSDVWELRVVD